MIAEHKSFGHPDPQWCLALHGNHDEHQCQKKPGHDKITTELKKMSTLQHECYCGVWW